MFQSLIVSGKEKKRGMTLIELIISISILSLLLGISVTVFQSMTNQQKLDRDVETAASYILRARNQTITGEDGAQYGIHFATTSVTMFKGVTYQAGSSTNIVSNFRNPTYMNAINLSGGVYDIYFQKITGKPSATGTVIYWTSAGTSTRKLINIYGSGLIEVQ